MNRKTEPDQRTWSQHFRPGRPIREVHEFSREQIERMVKMAAKSDIIGSMYVGDIGTQRLQWRDDGSAVVTTEHAPALENAVTPRIKMA